MKSFTAPNPVTAEWDMLHSRVVYVTQLTFYCVTSVMDCEVSATSLKTGKFLAIMDAEKFFAEVRALRTVFIHL